MAKPKTHGPAARTKSMQGTPYLSVVIPLLDEEESLGELYRQIVQAASSLKKPFEMIFVDDGSTDNSFGVLQELHDADSRVKAIRFRRNFGKSAALSVGFHQARGDVIITMDADLQDDPAEIPALIETLEQGYDLVSGWKKRRHDPISKTIPSRLANSVTAFMTGIAIHDMNCGLKAYRKEVVRGISVYGELHRYIPALAHWAGFRVGEKVVQHRPRKYGHTKFGISRLSRGFLDLLTVLFTTRYIRRPLHLFGIWGLISFLIGVIITGYLSVEWFFGRTSLSNRPLFLLGILFIIIGVQFISFGLLGEMINRQQRDETTYSIKEILN
jgi:glycosyltransferase involved in cell wall biosynthesis